MEGLHYPQVPLFLLPKQEKEALDWLYAAQLFGVKLGLENTNKLLQALELPAAGQQFIHVAGTNGKGSVSAFCHSLLTAARVNAGLFTSPHLIHFRERIKDAERCISAAEIVEGVNILQKASAGWDPLPTFFELTFTLATDWFRKRKREWVVLETGMGGRLDATNTVTPAVSIITSISLDHQAMLGQTLREIANEKAGIIKPGVPVVTIRQVPEAMEVISKTARERDAPLTVVTTPLRGYELGLFGPHQVWNAALAVAALKAAGFKLTENILRQGLKKVDWPARFQRFEKERIILDGAHNPDAADTLVRAWQAAFPGEKASIIFGGVVTKDIPAIVRALQPIAARWHLTGFRSPRSVPAAEVAASLKKTFGNSVSCHTSDTIEEALSAAKKDPERILITGSLYLAGEMLAHLRGEEQMFQASAQ